MKEKIVKFSIEWGKISFDGSSLSDIIFVEGNVKPRSYDRIEKKYGTAHLVDLQEAKELLKGSPLEVIIGTGFEGLLKLTPEAETMLKQRTALLVLTSPQAVDRINEMLRKNERISALIHATC